MDTIIGLGKAGCNIARGFEKYPQYNVFKLDIPYSNEKNYYCLKPQENPENYEKNCPDLTYFFKNVQGKTLFITTGASLLSSCSLTLLEQIKDRCNISILYIKPEQNELAGKQLIHENIIFNVFQEYTRSGVFDEMIIVSNHIIENVMGGLAVFEYYDKINEMITSTIHMINIFENSKSIINTFSFPHEIARICTLGIVNPDSSGENLFYNLDAVRESRYYYAVPSTTLKTDKTLLKKVRDKISSKAGASYGVYSTKYDHEYIYVFSRSSQIQKSEKST